MQFVLNFLLKGDLSSYCCRSFGENNPENGWHAELGYKPAEHSIETYDEHDEHDDHDDECGQSRTWLWYVRALHQLGKQGKMEEEKVM